MAMYVTLAIIITDEEFIYSTGCGIDVILQSLPRDIKTVFVITSVFCVPLSCTVVRINQCHQKPKAWAFIKMLTKRNECIDQ